MTSIAYRSGYKYQLADDYHFYVGIPPLSRLCATEYLALNRDGHLSIRRGYAWDGPSGPTVDTKTFMRGSLVHDALYQLIRLGLVDEDHRKAADDLLYQICRADGMWWPRAQWVYYGVRWFAGGADDYGTDRPLQFAP